MYKVYMAQKKKSAKQKKKQPTQKQPTQKQTQKQTVIVNVLSGKKGATKPKKSSSSSSYLSGAKQPLFTTLPIQYTPYTTYDTSRLLTQESINRNQLIEPQVQNAIPILNLARDPARPPLIGRQLATQTEQDDVFTAKEFNDYTLEQEKERQRDIDFNRKTQQTMSRTYPTPAELHRRAQTLSSLPVPPDNSIQINELSNIMADMADTRRILKRNNQEAGETLSTASDEYQKDSKDESEYQITSDNKYYCNVCNSSIVNTRSSIRTHKETLKHRRNLANSLMGK